MFPLPDHGDITESGQQYQYGFDIALRSARPQTPHNLPQAAIMALEYLNPFNTSSLTTHPNLHRLHGGYSQSGFHHIHQRVVNDHAVCP